MQQSEDLSGEGKEEEEGLDKEGSTIKILKNGKVVETVKLLINDKVAGKPTDYEGIHTESNDIVLKKVVIDKSGSVISFKWKPKGKKKMLKFNFMQSQANKNIFNQVIEPDDEEMDPEIVYSLDVTFKVKVGDGKDSSDDEEDEEAEEEEEDEEDEEGDEGDEGEEDWGDGEKPPVDPAAAAEAAAADLVPPAAPAEPTPADGRGSWLSGALEGEG